MKLAITCASGGYRVAFIQGVLHMLEKAGIQAEAYAGTSASVVPAALAALGQHNTHGLDYITGLLLYKSIGRGMSGAVLESITTWEALIQAQLWQPDRPRFCVPVSAVITSEAREQTQGNRASRLGRKLLLDAARHDRDWVNTHLQLALFDTQAVDPQFRLTPMNFGDVAYASSRMLHAWEIPAWIGDHAYIDGSYTCSCPVLELAAANYDEIIAIYAETAPAYHDLFSTKPLPSVWQSTRIHTIHPDVDLKNFGVDFTQASEAGLLVAHQHGIEKGQAFLECWRQ